MIRVLWELFGRLRQKIAAQPKWLRRGCVWENAAEDGNYGFDNVQYCMPQCSKSHCGA